ncbi:MAG TPA: sugar phosphate nucleotidyltransferase [Candidatus Paceibacterota bacterium]
MKLVILAAGKGKRMGESSNHTPKPILKYKGETLIEHKLEQIPAQINEIIVVIGHLGEKIALELGTDYKGIPIVYVQQHELLGTAHSLWQAKDQLMAAGEPFLVLMGDDLYAKEDLEAMISSYEADGNWVALVQKVDQQMTAGKCVVDENGFLIAITEDPEGKISQNVMYTGGCLLTPDVFQLPMVPVSETEFGLPQTFMQKTGLGGQIKALYATYWKRITAPEDLAD